MAEQEDTYPKWASNGQKKKKKRKENKKTASL